MTLLKPFLALLSALFISLSTFAQTDIELPEFNDVVMHIKSDNSLSTLDKTDITTKSKENLMRRFLVYMSAKGETSKVTLSGKTDDRFIVTIQQGIDPEGAVELFKFDEIKKNSREILLASISGGWGATKNIELPKQILNYKKVKPGTYIITSANKLEPGEYVFLVNRPNISELGAGGKAIRGYCFKVE